MARKDDILTSFLQHEILIDKYQIDSSELPTTVREALNSPDPIINVIAQIIDKTESSPPTTDKSLREMILQYLRLNAI